MRLLIVGPPGAGKGTQAEGVAARFGIAHISTGEMFRALDAGTELGRRVQEIMEGGDYVPDEITIEMLRKRMTEPDATRGFILDGFPRTLGQATALDDEMKPEGLDRVVVLDVPEEVLVSRLLARGRSDDTEDAIRTRLEIYRAETEPLIGFYQECGLVLPVSGVGAIDEITERIIEALEA